jgi:predicted  nucleic acid-binding Zn-ribbon protein
MACEDCGHEFADRGGDISEDCPECGSQNAYYTAAKMTELKFPSKPHSLDDEIEDQDPFPSDHHPAAGKRTMNPQLFDDWMYRGPGAKFTPGNPHAFQKQSQDFRDERGKLIPREDYWEQHPYGHEPDGPDKEWDRIRLHPDKFKARWGKGAFKKKSVSPNTWSAEDLTNHVSIDAGHGSVEVTDVYHDGDDIYVDGIAASDGENRSYRFKPGQPVNVTAF